MTQAAPRHGYTLRDCLDVEGKRRASGAHRRWDRGEKPEHYQRIDALNEYVLLSQDTPKIEPWSKASASGAWSYAAYGPGDVVDLRSIGRRLDVNELYAVAGVTKP